MNSVAQFKQRENCVSCGSSSFHSIWKGRFNEIYVKDYLQQHFYNADLPLILKDNEFNLVQCDQCGMMFHARILTQDWLKVLYSEWIDSTQIEKFEAAYGIDTTSHAYLLNKGKQLLKHALRLNHLLEKNFPHAKNFNILDYGCGDGRFLAAANMFGFNAYGIDFSTTRIARSAQSGIAIFNSLQAFEEQQIENLHAITLFETLEHVDEPLALLNKLASYLQPKGVLIVEVPDCSEIRGRPETADAFHEVHPLEHINNFTPKTLRTFCERAGFSPISRLPAHITTATLDLLKTEASRFIQLQQTSQYFIKN